MLLNHPAIAMKTQMNWQKTAQTTSQWPIQPRPQGLTCSINYQVHERSLSALSPSFIEDLLGDS
ncbi:MAG: hypothetical protein IGR92_07380 [Leptolyngbyaceae cyanobacterium T60_A2020_046]|nr:hypothetical protein [Leptolyngbyaceae cyanobacterium T60_A2020_046]